MTALAASVSLSGAGGRRREVKMGAFVRGVLETALEPDEIIDGVSIPKLASGVRWGYHKIWRKTGEFAEAIGAVVIQGETCRAVAGAASGRPVVIETGIEAFANAVRDSARLSSLLSDAGLQGDLYEMKIHTAAVRRAFEEALAR
jgi:carbon-monoxide dehydrogenase medium subunit